MLAMILLRAAGDTARRRLPMLELPDIVRRFAFGVRAADDRSPVAQNARSKAEFAPGIGPHSEAQIVALAMNEVQAAGECRYGLSIPYPELPRQRCDLCIGEPGH